MRPTDAVVLRALDGPLAGEYLVTYDPEASEGQGYVESTRDLQHARRMSVEDAWRLLGTSKPMRPDGKPNRPLTATTWQICSIEPAD